MSFTGSRLGVDGRVPLPELVELAAFNGNAIDYIEALYGYFCADFVDVRVLLKGKPIVIDRTLIEGKCARFWHLVSTGPIEEDRLLDMRRCERLRWARHLIEHCTTGEFAFWRTGKRLLIATRDFEYLVVLEERRHVVVLISAYCKERQHGRDQLKRQYEQADERFN